MAVGLQAAGAAERAAAAGAAAAGVLAGGPRRAAGLQGHPVRAEGKPHRDLRPSEVGTWPEQAAAWDACVGDYVAVAPDRNEMNWMQVTHVLAMDAAGRAGAVLPAAAKDAVIE